MVQGIRRLRNIFSIWRRSSLHSKWRTVQNVIDIGCGKFAITENGNRRRMYIIWINLQLKQEIKIQPN